MQDTHAPEPAPARPPPPPGRRPTAVAGKGRRLRAAIICDVDGTIALKGTRSPYAYERVIDDAPNAPIIQLLNLVAGKVAILLVSGRPEDARSETHRWLAQHDVPYTHLLMRKARDNRQDAIIKEELYRQTIEPNWRVLFVLDDRARVVKMWRSLDLTCLQVAEGDF